MLRINTSHSPWRCQMLGSQVICAILHKQKSIISNVFVSFPIINDRHVSCNVVTVCNGSYHWELLCQQIPRAAISNYIPRNLWGVHNCPCPWLLFLAPKLINYRKFRNGFVFFIGCCKTKDWNIQAIRSHISFQVSSLTLGQLRGNPDGRGEKGQ